MNFVLPAPAKLNLFLHITGRRSDGYHTLETAFQLIDFTDELEFSVSAGTGVSLQCELAELQTDNLILRAADLLSPYIQTPGHVRIRLTKHIPMGGGLGGGSSDAATTLLALNAIWHCQLDEPALMALGLKLGADVPVFLRGSSAFATGVGETLTPIDIPDAWYVVITPPCQAQTREIFTHPELTRDSPPLKIRAFPFTGTRNDCQTAACTLYPVIQQALDWLGNFAVAKMTGTGASVFASFPEQTRAAQVLEHLNKELPKDWTGFCARGLNRSPVLALLAQQVR